MEVNMSDGLSATTTNETNSVLTLWDINSRLRTREPDEPPIPEPRPDPKPQTEHWQDPPRRAFTKAQRSKTTILLGGLTLLHDDLLESMLTGLGYKSKSLNNPDNEAMRVGKEYGNRGQCNPTYFTVGNLVKYLIQLRDEDGLSAEEIVDTHVFMTIGGCGPCRFGTYITEYRKALRDAGFEGFRLYDFSKYGDHVGNPGASGIELDWRLYKVFFKAIIAGDVINTQGYRIRPYELVPGATNKVLADCHDILCEAFAANRSILKALRKCRKILETVEVNRLQVKPKVAIIGEFWAMTTEGDGNYYMQRFLEEEGAECEIQIPTNWALYRIWGAAYDIRERMLLRRREGIRDEQESTSPLKLLAALWLADKGVKIAFRTFARAGGLKNYHLPDMEEIAQKSHDFYSNQLRGGEGHMEVGKVIDFATEKRAHMVISVKPFGCMPSSGVSDGVQSLVSARFPEIIFTPIETSGDGAVSAQSRIQMALFKARKKAQDEFDAALAATSMNISEVTSRPRVKQRLSKALYYPRHKVAGTGANTILEVVSASKRN